LFNLWIASPTGLVEKDCIPYHSKKEPDPNKFNRSSKINSILKKFAFNNTNSENKKLDKE